MSTNPFALSKVKNVVAISSCKGGVGKSTIACAMSPRTRPAADLKVGLAWMQIFTAPHCRRYFSCRFQGPIQ